MKCERSKFQIRIHSSCSKTIPRRSWSSCRPACFMQNGVFSGGSYLKVVICHGGLVLIENACFSFLQQQWLQRLDAATKAISCDCVARPGNNFCLLLQLGIPAQVGLHKVGLLLGPFHPLWPVLAALNIQKVISFQILLCLPLRKEAVPRLKQPCLHYSFGSRKKTTKPNQLVPSSTLTAAPLY